MEFPWRAKQHQAVEHLGRFAAACEVYLREKNVGLRHEVDTETGTIRVRLHADAAPPLALGATVGDILHNLRSALDAVAWAACRQAGPLTEEEEKRVQFPVTRLPKDWGSARGNLPLLKPEHLDVFRVLQPWWWDERARENGVDVPDSAAERHSMYRLHDLAKVDRHRLVHPVLARAGHTWLGHSEGVEVEVQVYRAGAARPGDVFLEWRVDPPAAAADVVPDGEVVLALSEGSAIPPRSAIAELQAMHQAVVSATRRVEVEVLHVLTAADLDGLAELERAWREAAGALESLVTSDHVIDRDYIETYKAAAVAEERGREAYALRWRQLFE